VLRRAGGHRRFPAGLPPVATGPPWIVPTQTALDLRGGGKRSHPGSSSVSTHCHFLADFRSKSWSGDLCQQNDTFLQNPSGDRPFRGLTARWSLCCKTSMDKCLSRIDRASSRALLAFYRTKPISGFERSRAHDSGWFCQTKPIHVQTIDTGDLEARPGSRRVETADDRPLRSAVNASGKRSGLSIKSGGDEPRRARWFPVGT
jgi:hypothetical protein